MSEEGRTINRPKAWDKFDAMQMLQEHVVPGEDGLCEYVGDWSDEKIAEATGLIETSIAELRRQRYGKLRPKRKPNRPRRMRRAPALVGNGSRAPGGDIPARQGGTSGWVTSWRGWGK